MISLEDLSQEISQALKNKDTVRLETLRALKTRVTNEQIAKGGQLDEATILALFRSELKRRTEAAEAFRSGGREELAQHEDAQGEIIKSFLPQGPSEADINTAIDELLSAEALTVKDFGKAMGSLKSKFPNADGAVLSSLLKAKLN